MNTETGLIGHVPMSSLLQNIRDCHNVCSIYLAVAICIATTAESIGRFAHDMVGNLFDIFLINEPVVIGVAQL